MSPWPATTVGMISGLATRLALLRTDYRRYPGYPHDYINHLFLGAVAALLGAVLPPALAEHNYAAVTFLALVAQQFRDVRRLEREALSKVEPYQLVPRGAAYIEGVARVFESRNYLVMGVALLSAAVAYWAEVQGAGRTAAVVAAVALGTLLTGWAAAARQGRHIGDLARIRTAPVRFEGADLFVDDVQIANVGDADSRQEILRHGLGAVLEPLDADSSEALADPGQRQALLYDAARVLGVRRDVDTPEFTPLARRQLATGKVGLCLVPTLHDPERLVAVLAATPVLQGSRGTAASFRPGRKG